MLCQRTQFSQRRAKEFPQIDRAIGKLETESQAIWLTRNIRRSLKVDKADQTHGAFRAKVQIRPLLTQTSQRLRDLRYDSAPGVVWPGPGDAADGRANEGQHSQCWDDPGVRTSGVLAGLLVHGWLEREMIPMVILGPGSIESNGCQRSALSSLSPTTENTKRMYLAKRGT